MSCINCGFLPATQRRTNFKKDLQIALAHARIILVSAELSRGTSNISTWHVVIDHKSRGIERLFADFTPIADPYSADTLNDLIGRILMSR